MEATEQRGGETIEIQIPRLNAPTDIDAENQARRAAMSRGFYITSIPTDPTLDASTWTVILEGHYLEEKTS